jgi:beta-glucosidase
VKVSVDPGKPETVEVELTAASFRYWDVDTEGWRSDPGRYEVMVGASSRDITATVPVEWTGEAAG